MFLLLPTPSLLLVSTLPGRPIDPPPDSLSPFKETFPSRPEPALGTCPAGQTTDTDAGRQSRRRGRGWGGARAEGLQAASREIPARETPAARQSIGCGQLHPGPVLPCPTI